MEPHPTLIVLVLFMPRKIPKDLSKGTGSILYIGDLTSFFRKEFVLIYVLQKTCKFVFINQQYEVCLIQIQKDEIKKKLKFCSILYFLTFLLLVTL